MFFLRAIFLAALPLLFAVNVSARDFTGPEKAELEKRVAHMNAVGKSGDMEAVVDLTAPEIMDYMAKQLGLGVDVVRQRMIAAQREVMDKMQRYEVFIDMSRVRYLTTDAGVPYALIPQDSTVIPKDGPGVSLTSHVIAFLHDGDWRLLAVSNKEMMTPVFDVYPILKEAELPPMKSRVMEPGKE